MTLKERINEDMKAAMRAREAARLGAIRLLLAAIKQKEVDERIMLDDAAVVAIIDRMLKQRRDSIAQFRAAARHELADAEQAEADLLGSYLPAGLSDAEIDAAISGAIDEASAGGAAGPALMGKVMGTLKAKLAGRCDMSEVSRRVKNRLAGA